MRSLRPRQTKQMQHIYGLLNGLSHAGRWLDGLERAIRDLDVLPMRCLLARESGEFKEPIRQLLYGTAPHIYRVLFIVRPRTVYVLHIRHGARDAIPAVDIVFPPDDGESL